MIANREALVGQRARQAVRVGHLERERIWHWAGFGFALLLSAVLNTWNLAQNGYSNAYYSAAVQSMLQSWRNFFFASYDAGGFITVDKPPVALWVQAISAKIFGFSSLSLLLPEALAGVACVAIVYYLVRRVFGTLAAFVAAVALAITPVAVAVERGNNTDTLLMLFLLLAAWALTKATEKGKLVLLMASMALVGVAFKTKMLAAFIVLPAFYLLYLVGAPLKLWKRLGHLAVGSVVLLVVSFSWATAVQLIPADQRPWIGGSQTNSVFDLALNYNGLGRVTGEIRNTMGGGATRTQGDFTPPSGAQSDTAQPPAGSPPAGVDGRNSNGASGMFGAGVAGPLRLFGSELASQWSWLFPLAAIGTLAAVLGLKRRLPLDRRAHSLMLWGGWLATYGVVFSMAQGIFHTYYLIMLAPAAAALVGIGVASLWRQYREGGWKAWLLPVALVATAAWQAKVVTDYNYPQWSQWLIPVALGGALVAAVPLAISRFSGARILRRVSPVLVGMGLLALAASPFAWSLTPAMAAGNGIMPVAGPSNTGARGFGQGANGQMGNGGPGGEYSSSLISYLEQNRDGYFYLVAVSSANQASTIALETGEPVLAMGGFSGTDPAMTVEKLQQMVASKQVCYVLVGGQGMGGGQGASSAVTQWIQSNGTAVDSSQYGGNGTLYDLSPASD